LPAALHALTSAEFLYQEALYPDAEYAFKHPLTQEVAYRSQLTERRSRVHAAVARAIEELESAKLGECAALLAYHWEHAGDAREAAKWHRRAAEWVGFNNSAEALRHWGSVRELLDTLPETPESLAERAAVRAHIMIHLARIGDLEDEATSLFREGRQLATRSGDPHVLSQVLNGFGYVRLYTIGAVEEALDPLLEATRRADETEDMGLRVAVRYGVSSAHWNAGRFRECIAVAEQGLDLAHGDLDLGTDRLGFSPSLGLSSFRGAALSLTGLLRDGAAELDRVIERARTSQQLMPLYLSHGVHVIRCEVTGEAAPALAHGREAVNYAERMGSQFSRLFAYLSLGIANVLNGARHDALEALRTALTIGRERRLSVYEGAVLATMAAAHLGLGDRARALTTAEEALAVCRRRGARLWDFSALLTRIRALRETHGLEAARDIEATLAEADAWLEMSGAKSYEPFLHVERAELARLTGDEAARGARAPRGASAVPRDRRPDPRCRGREGARVMKCAPMWWIVWRCVRPESASPPTPIASCSLCGSANVLRRKGACGFHRIEGLRLLALLEAVEFRDGQRVADWVPNHDDVVEIIRRRREHIGALGAAPLELSNPRVRIAGCVLVEPLASVHAARLVGDFFRFHEQRLNHPVLLEYGDYQQLLRVRPDRYETEEKQGERQLPQRQSRVTTLRAHRRCIADLVRAVSVNDQGHVTSFPPERELVTRASGARTFERDRRAARMVAPLARAVNQIAPTRSA
jgi:tetratricopeptide (TPR) repeat protein